jgi:hypothetical protein
MDEPLLSEEGDPGPSIYGNHRRSLLTPFLLAALLIVTLTIELLFRLFHNSLSQTSKYIIDSISILTGTSFICGATCFIALKLILRPCCNARRGNEIGELVETLFAQYIFSQDVIDAFMQEKTESLGSPHSLKLHASVILDSGEFASLMDDTIDNFFRSAQGAVLEELGMSRATIGPFVKGAVNRAVMSNCVEVVQSILRSEQLSSVALSGAARGFLLKRCEEMDPGVVSDAIEEMIGSNATLVVFAGIGAGAFCCILSRIVGYFLKP